LVFALAERTGWAIDYILWEIPLSVIHQANHTFLWLSGARIRRPTRADKEQYKNLERLLGLTGK